MGTVRGHGMRSLVFQTMLWNSSHDVPGSAVGSAAESAVFSTIDALGPALYWPLAGASAGTAFQDYGYLSASATVSGSPSYNVSSLVSGEVSGGVYFNGTSDGMRSNVFNIADRTAITVGAWINSAEAPASSAPTKILGNQMTGLFWNHPTAASRGSFLAHMSAAGDTFTASFSTISSGTHLVLGTYDGSTLKAYADGHLTDATAVVDVISSAGVAWFIANQNAATNYEGTIQHAFVIASAITSAQVSAIYAAGT